MTKTALKIYLDAERGRGARLADELGISRSYMSDLAAGNKDASASVWRRIAEATGLNLADLMGKPQGMSEGHASPYEPGPKANRLRDMVGILFPGMRHPSYYVAEQAHLAFGILPGDLLVTEARFDPNRISPGQLVVARIADDNHARTVIGRTANPWLVDATGQVCGEIPANTAVLGLIEIVVRSSDPAAI